MRKMTHNAIKNEVTGETVTLIERTEQYELLEYTMPPSFESIAHYHRHFKKEIKVLDGMLKIDLGTTKKILSKDDLFIIQKGVNHSLANYSNNASVVLQVKISPAYHVYEATKVLFGLAKDGLVDEKGMPNNRTHLAIVYDMLDIRIHLPRLLDFLMKNLIKSGKKKGIDQILLNQYALDESSKEESNETFI